MKLPNHRRCLFYKLLMIAALFMTCNLLVLCKEFLQSNLQRGLIISTGVLFFIAFSIYPHKEKGSKRLAILYGGYRIVDITRWVIILECIAYGISLFEKIEIGGTVLICNAVIALAIQFLLLMNGLLRMIFVSKQVSILWRVAFFFLWYIPVVHLILFLKICHKVKIEYLMEHERMELAEMRKEKDICNTRYPILLVHGVFFRDWQLFNYWGRIPKALIKNGARVYYGSQQSAAAVAVSGEELAIRIEEVLRQTNAEKVNIIAHSKGGLDSRYAISLLGMGTKVASLTTVNTPHLGCKWVDRILHSVPEWLLQYVADRYNKVFTKLGDKKPDFISAAFPLNLGYVLAKGADGENDGLVGEGSAKYGNFLGLISTKGKRGVSHGDVIDLNREDIVGYDVQEFYINLVKQLKERGF